MLGGEVSRTVLAAGAEETEWRVLVGDQKHSCSGWGHGPSWDPESARPSRSWSAPGTAVSKGACTSARDPAAYLHEPVVVETADSLTVYWTSKMPEGAQTCPGEPSVTRTIEPSEPLGDRALLDGSRWPPVRIGG